MILFQWTSPPPSQRLTAQEDSFESLHTYKQRCNLTNATDNAIATGVIYWKMPRRSRDDLDTAMDLLKTASPSIRDWKCLSERRLDKFGCKGAPCLPSHGINLTQALVFTPSWHQIDARVGPSIVYYSCSLWQSLSHFHYVREHYVKGPPLSEGASK